MCLPNDYNRVQKRKKTDHNASLPCNHSPLQCNSVSSHQEVGFLSPWIWTSLRTCFDQSNVLEAVMYQFSGWRGLALSVFFLPREQAHGSLVDDEKHGAQPPHQPQWQPASPKSKPPSYPSAHCNYVHEPRWHKPTLQNHSIVSLKKRKRKGKKCGYFNH